MATQKIILTHEVPGLGSSGDVVEVKNGYARNYLIPRGEAVRWTKAAETQIELLRAGAQARAERSLEDAQAQAAELSAEPVRIQMPSGDNGRLFGSVTAADIAAALEEAGHKNVDRRSIIVRNSIRVLGNHDVQVRLHDDVLAEVTVAVQPAAKK